MSKPFTMAAVLLLLVVAAAHVVRLVMNLDVMIAGYPVPMSISIAAAVAAGSLALLVSREARH